MINATADNVWTYLVPPKCEGADLAAYKKWKAEREPTAEDRELARKALEYAREELRNRPELNDYLHNLMVSCSQTSITAKLAGITASLISHYVKEVERRTLKEVEAKKLAASTYAGTVGDRLIFRGCRVLHVIQLEGNFGTTLLHKMVDAEGHALTWFSSGESLGVGAEVDLLATVKNHEEYKGVKQTVVSRGVVLTGEDLKREEAKQAKKVAKAAAEAALTPEQRQAKADKAAARKAKADATAAENKLHRTWCSCRLLMKDCPVHVNHVPDTYYSYKDGVHNLDWTNRQDAREQPDYQERLAKAVAEYAATHPVSGG